MSTRVKFLGLAVFFAMVAFLGAVFLAKGMGADFRNWVMAIAGAVCCALSLVGVIVPDKMKWLLDGWKKRNGG